MTTSWALRGCVVAGRWFGGRFAKPAGHMASLGPDPEASTAEAATDRVSLTPAPPATTLQGLCCLREVETQQSAKLGR